MKLINNLRLIGKIGKIISIIFLIYGLLNVIIGTIFELIFKDIYDAPGEKSGLVAIFIVLFFVLIVFFALKLMGIYVVIISGITLFLSIICLKYSKKSIEEIKEDKLIIYLVSIGYLLISLVFLILMIIFIDNIFLFGILFLIFVLVYGFVGFNILTNNFNLNKCE